MNYLDEMKKEPKESESSDEKRNEEGQPPADDSEKENDQ
jgi:hypothetical protein